MAGNSLGTNIYFVPHKTRVSESLRLHALLRGQLHLVVFPPHFGFWDSLVGRDVTVIRPSKPIGELLWVSRTALRAFSCERSPIQPIQIDITFHCINVIGFQNLG